MCNYVGLSNNHKCPDFYQDILIFQVSLSTKYYHLSFISKIFYALLQ